MRPVSNAVLRKPLCRPLAFRSVPRITYHRDRRRPISAYGYVQAKALVYSKYGEPKDVLSLHGHSISPSHSNQITVRFLASPINPADINQIQGVYPTKPPFGITLGTPSPSAVGGNEGVAEVISTGSQVRDLRRGDWVVMAQTGFGTWRTHAQTDASQVFQINDKAGLTPTQVGTVSVNPCTAYRMLRDFVALDPGRGDWFIQNGANSGVGRAAIQLGRRWGYKSINVVRDRADSAALDALKQDLHALGADVVVTESELLERGFVDRVKEWTRGGREHIPLGLNCVGGKSATALAKVLSITPSTPDPSTSSSLSSSPSQSQTQSAHLVTYGAMAKQPVLLPASLLIFKNVTFTGFWVSQWSDENPAEKKRTVEEILDLVRRGEFRDTPVREIEWRDAPPPSSTSATASAPSATSAGSGGGGGGGGGGGSSSKDLEASLISEIQTGLEGYRDGKGVFVFKE
ncbi:MAG: mitochondrial 2-enoyl thioester reductase [Sclerophora amabilis]|nr:MAG: mitochondrial 2-enoyl thioester reductase [Sclerophora amabilis]